MAYSSVLVVDDEPDNFDVIESLLSDRPYQLHYVSNGIDALESLDLFQPDVILLDVMMPGLDGIEVCARIKAMPDWHTVPIVIVTALTEKKDLARCMAAGADDFITKPINGIELRARVQSMLRIKQTYIDLEQQVQTRTAALQAKAERDRVLSIIATQICASFDFNEIVETTVQEVQQLFQCRAVAIWQLQSSIADHNSQVATVVAAAQDPTMAPLLKDRDQIHLSRVRLQAYQLEKGNDATVHFQDLMTDCPEKFPRTAHCQQLAVPILQNEKLWGFLSVIHCQNSEHWPTEEQEFLKQLSTQLAIALQQAQAYHQLQTELNERRQTEVRLRESEQRYINLANAVPVGIFRTDANHQCLYVNQRWSQITGYSTRAAMGMGWLDYIHPDDQVKFQDEWQRFVNEQRPFQLEYRLRSDCHEDPWVFGQVVAEYDAQDQVVGYVGTVTDISALKRAEAQILHNALHDLLTNLPNRSLLTERLELAINRSKRVSSYRYAVLFLDLDQFKVINDSLGHLIGDRLLVQMAQNLKSYLRFSDFLARVGGDEFVILLEDLESLDAAVRMAEGILSSFEKPIAIDDYEIVITASIGIVLGSADYDHPSDLLRDADIAMYRAKSSGRSTYKIFGAEMHHQAINRLTLETDLRKALTQEEFRVYYQPVINLAKGRLVGFEALARWHHATRGWISPAEFIPVAEETGVIQQLSRWILRQACQQLLHWQRSFPEFAPLKMSVNLSAQELRKPTMVSEILQTLDEVGLEPHYLTLEITESMLIEDINQTIELLTELKRHHIQISIDDFGTGYSSLSYLHRLPADYLKIDRSFVGQMEKGNRNFQVVSTIVALSNQLGLDVVAEGVETQQQLRWLEQLGCEFGQGYWFAKPLPPQEIENQFFTEGLNPGLIEEERRSVINQSLVSRDQPRSGPCSSSSV